MKRLPNEGPLFLGVFSYIEDLLSAIERAKQSGWTIREVFSPAPNDDIEEAVGETRNTIRFITLAGGIAGGLFGYSLSIFSFMQWKLVVWGKPFLAWVPFSLIAYELTILSAVICTFFGVLFLSKSRPRGNIPGPYDPRFSVDHFGILVSCSHAERDSVIGGLNEVGAKEIREYE